MKIYLLLIYLMCAVFTALSAEAQSVSVQFSKRARGGERFAIVGRDHCQADSFSIKVYAAGAEPYYYRSQRGNNNWNIVNCRFNQELSRRLLVSGVSLTVETFSGPLLVGTFSIQIPKNKIKKQSAQPSMRATALPDKNSCQVVSSTKDSVVYFKAHCLKSEFAQVTVLSAKNILCEKSILLSRDSKNPEVICAVTRDPLTTQYVQLIIQTRQETFEFSKTIAKSPTFQFSPQVRLLLDSPIQIKKMSKKLGRGYYWSGSVSAQVFDRDSDNEEPLIHVQLIEVRAGQEKVIDRAVVRTGGLVTFHFEHQLVQQFIWNDGYHEGPFSVGANTAFLRIFDAYSTTKFIDSESFQIYLQP